ncbi:MAG: DUF924 domain-containing protein [Pseudogulbenkiania sp.]|nr:DUF924 domain-containing protein [Pseudogulbenkiania sp.]
MSDWAEQLLTFWFGGVSDAELNRPRREWFAKSDAFDREIAARFGPLWLAARTGRLRPTSDTPLAWLAWMILTDQLPRNLHRGRAEAFASDALALTAARHVVSTGLDQALPPVARGFVYLPFEHSEELADQDEAVRLFATLTAYPGQDGVLDYACRHRAVIERFGRFPHRNAALGRESTAEEAAFLKEPGSSF